MRNRKSKSVIITMILSCIMVMISCTNNKGSDDTALTPDISFSKDIIPIFMSSCALNSSCHSGARNTGDNIDLDSSAAYAAMGANQLVNYSNPTASLIYVEVSSDIMPKAPNSPLSGNQIALILNWIKQGAKNN